MLNRIHHAQTHGWDDATIRETIERCELFGENRGVPTRQNEHAGAELQLLRPARYK